MRPWPKQGQSRKSCWPKSVVATILGLLKSGKLILRCANETDVTFRRATRESQFGFSHKETLHDGTAQSIVNDLIPREGSGQPDVDPQRGAWPQQFVIGTMKQN